MKLLFGGATPPPKPTAAGGSALANPVNDWMLASFEARQAISRARDAYALARPLIAAGAPPDAISP